MPDQIETYVETAMDQVRWKKARPGLAAEILTHLLDQRDACLAQGKGFLNIRQGSQMGGAPLHQVQLNGTHLAADFFFDQPFQVLAHAA